MSQIFCNNCGEPNNDTDTVCRKCVTPIIKEKKIAAEEKKPSILITILVVIVIALVGAFAKGAAKRAFSNAEAKYDVVLLQAANEINKTLPRTVDSETVLNSVTAMPGKQFYYQYTLINFDKEDINVQYFEETMSPNILNGIKTSSLMQNFRDNEVTMVYSYMDKNGKEIMTLKFGPEDYK